MKIEFTTFKSSIAKRIFLLFILAALLPVSIFAFFSIRQIDQITNENIQIRLQKDAKAYSYVLTDRLSTRSTAMTQIASAIELNHKTTEWELKKTHKFWFSSLSLLENNRSLKIFWGASPDIKALSNDESNFLQSGKTLILHSTDNNLQKVKIIMLKQVSLATGETALLISTINNSQLLGNEDSFNQRTGFCVINHEKKILFCSKSDIDQTLLSMISKNNLASRGQLIWSENDVTIYSGFNTLFLEYHYFQKDWMIVFAQKKSESMFYRKDFNNIFYSIIAITLIFVFYISFLIIRQQMRPLDALMQGISRVSTNNFDQPVAIRKNNEFGKLAKAFNHMSELLKTQLSVLKTSADIDQMILSRLKTHDIIKMVITHANDIIDSDEVSITLLTKEEKTQATMYTADPQITGEVIEKNYQVNADTLNDILNKRIIQFTQNETQWNDIVQPLIKKGFKSFLVISIRNQGKQSAFITFAFQNQPTISPTMKTWGLEFADRIAIAFANASWEKQLFHQAHYDALTGLPNRLMLNEHLQYEIDQAERNHSMPVVLFLDLDKFKYINDSLGHLIGDNLLKQVAKRIDKCLRKTDTVARLGGDEFIVILSGYNNLASFDLVKTVNKILSEICKPIVLEEHSLRITSSIGIAIYPQDGKSIESLLKNADTAMYEAKKQGRARYQFYSKELNSNMLKKLLLDADLHNALENNELQLYYQAKVDTKTGLIIGAEALMRWVYPDNGIISPTVFIPLMEQSGLIIPIGNWLIQESCRQNKEWQDKGLAKISVSVNLSSKQFRHEALLAEIYLALESSMLDAQYLEVEITESIAMEDFEASVSYMKEIQASGIQISIDDYGTGYSSLEYIKDFPVNILKIDRVFIINIAKSYKEQAIVKSTIMMAHDLGLKVIAEGVENEEQHLILQEMGCDAIQGFYFSKPIPAVEFEKLLIKKTIR